MKEESRALLPPLTIIQRPYNGPHGKFLLENLKFKKR